MKNAGFSLLEVMVAIAILGLALTGILSAQGSSASSNKHAASLGSAIHLGRCKMTEIEDELLRKGYSDVDETKADLPCCSTNMSAVELTGVTAYTCDARIERVTLPDPPAGGFGTDAGVVSPLGSNTPLGQIMTPDGQGLNLDAGLGSLTNTLAGGGENNQGTAGLLSFVMGMVYPSLKPVLEASIRRITITVKWKEGSREQEFALMQYVTNPQRGGFISGTVGLEVPPTGAGTGTTPAATAPGTPGTGGRR